MAHKDWGRMNNGLLHREPMKQALFLKDLPEHKMVWTRTKVPERTIKISWNEQKAWRRALYMFKVFGPKLSFGGLSIQQERSSSLLRAKAKANLAHLSQLLRAAIQCRCTDSRIADGRSPDPILYQRQLHQQECIWRASNESANQFLCINFPYILVGEVPWGAWFPS